MTDDPRRASWRGRPLTGKKRVPPAHPNLWNRVEKWTSDDDRRAVLDGGIGWGGKNREG
jgi:hypothetical protein